MKRLFFIAIVLAAAGMLFAQTGDPNPEMIGIDAAQQKLMEVAVDSFEHDGYWRSSMSSDEGYTSSRLFAGGPLPKADGGSWEPIPEGNGPVMPNKYVLGTRVDFLRRGHSSFTI